MIPHLIILFVLLLAALLPWPRLLTRRRVAVNSALGDLAPPAGNLSSTAIAARTAAMVSAGVPAMYAKQFATDAVEAQVWHDNPELRTGEQASPLTDAEKEARAIADAHRVDPSTMQVPGVDLEVNSAAVEQARQAAQDLAGRAATDREVAEKALTEAKRVLAEAQALKADTTPRPLPTNFEDLSLPQLQVLASERQIELGSAKEKGDIQALIRKAAGAVALLLSVLFFGLGTAQASQVAGWTPAGAVKMAALPEAVAAVPETGTRMLAVLTKPAVSAVALALAACAWLPKRWRSKARRPVAVNAVLTPLETNHGTETLDATAAITFKNALVTKSGAADDRHFKACSLVTDVPYGVLLNDEVGSDEVDVVKKAIAIFGLWPESLPAVTAEALAVNDRLVPDLTTPGRVKKLPTTTGTYLVIGRTRFAVAAAGDPVSIIHHTPAPVVVP